MCYVHSVAVDNGGSWPAPTVCIYKFLLAGDERSVAPERSTILPRPLRSEWRISFDVMTHYGFGVGALCGVGIILGATGGLICVPP